MYTVAIFVLQRQHGILSRCIIIQTATDTFIPCKRWESLLQITDRIQNKAIPLHQLWKNRSERQKVNEPFKDIAYPT